MEPLEALSMLKQALAEVTANGTVDIQALALDSDLGDLGLDSVTLMQMVGLVEDQLERILDQHELAKAKTLGDIASIVIRGRVGAVETGGESSHRPNHSSS